MNSTRRPFGFICPDFSVELSPGGFLLPRSRAATLGKALLPDIVTASITGRYNWRIHHGGAEVWKAPAVVAWARHRSVAGPFLVLKAARASEIRQRLEYLRGRDVELEFSPRFKPLDMTLSLRFA